MWQCVFVFLPLMIAYNASAKIGADPWVGFVRAAAEAGMVGGLADWFAVTALFRHPLGIPIPHTALIRRKKDQLGTSLGGFVGENFLDPEMVSEKVRGARIPERAGVEHEAQHGAQRVVVPLLGRALVASGSGGQRVGVRGGGVPGGRLGIGGIVHPGSGPHRQDDIEHGARHGVEHCGEPGHQLGVLRPEFESAVAGAVAIAGDGSVGVEVGQDAGAEITE